MGVSPTSQTGVLVLGAGLSGLSAALHLSRDGVRDVRHVERAGRVGGHAVTIEDDGFRFDRTGHLLHLRDDAMRELVLSVLGDEHVVVSRRSRVYSHGVYTRYPYQANTFGLPPAIAHECVMGFLAARRAEPRTIATFEDFCLAHFGEGISRHFMIPYNERLWGVPLSEITADWCARFVPLPNESDVIAGAVGLNDRELGYNASFVYPTRGIGALPDGLARLCPTIELGRAPSAIDWRSRRAVFDGETIEYRRMISTIPLDGLGRLLTDLPPDVAAAFARLRCTELYYLDVALDVPPLVDLHWVYVPERRFPFYRVGCYSQFSPAMAPPGKAGLYVELADRSPPDPARLFPEVVSRLVEMRLIGSPGDVRYLRVRHLPHAYVIHDAAHEPALAVLRPFLAAAGIASVGRYGAWNYSSMEDALRFGRDAARDVSEGTE
jgi:protoporphyrinogen oxidase